MKKGILLYLTVILCGLAGCASGNKNEATVSDQIDNEISAVSQADPANENGAAAPDPASVAAAPVAPAAPGTAPSTLGGAPAPAPAAPAAPAPATAPASAPVPATPIDEMAALHEKYAAAVGITKAEAETYWNKRMGASKPGEVAKNIESLNNFFGFLFDSDSELTYDVAMIKFHSSKVHDCLAGDKTMLPLMMTALTSLRKYSELASVETLEAAEIYGVDLKEVTDRNAEYVVSNGFVLPVLSVIRYIQTNGAVSNSSQDNERVQIAIQLQAIFHALTFSYHNASGDPAFVSNVSFLDAKPLLFKPIFAFETNHGGYGFVDGAAVRFVY
ncbi:MAG: hypothetical protein K8R69_02435 [Deltaproteobacteria bacterium]|nr:hypothetical protein [Deltaproteobacteria bacterium]